MLPWLFGGPFCPAYGGGALLVIGLIQPFRQDVFSIFMVGMIAANVLEYVTAVLLET